MANAIGQPLRLKSQDILSTKELNSNTKALIQKLRDQDGIICFR
jgi:hypothetical protein